MSDEAGGRLRVDYVDAQGLGRILEHLASTDLWARLCETYAVASDGGATPPEALPRAELVGILKLLFSELPEHVEFVGAADIAHLAQGDNPALVLAALCDAVVLPPAEEALDDADVTLDEDEVARESRAGRPIFRFRSIYTAERGADHMTFRLMGAVDGEERKLMLTIRKDRPVRSQIAHAEGLHSLQIVPAGRLQHTIELELARRRRG
ncbi:MAG: hypothetical protein H6744_17515 [Deltaproteobacteria bacterium]|nr:hypothetical protein [Deltaproteobacteria bacterium]